MRTPQVRSERNPYYNMFEDFDRMFEGIFAPAARGCSANFVPPYELVENEQGYLLSFDVPGIPKDEIQIEVKEQQLRVSGERKMEKKNAEGGRWYTERSYGRFERVFTLPADIDADKIEAHHEDGVLHLMLPKTEKVQPKTIKIESGPSGFFSKLVGKGDKVQ